MCEKARAPPATGRRSRSPPGHPAPLPPPSSTRRRTAGPFHPRHPGRGSSELKALFETECQKRRIRLFERPLCSPRLNAPVERAYRSHEVEFHEVTEVSWTVTVLDSVLREWERVHHTVRPHQSPGYRTLLRSSTTGAKPMEGGMRHGGTEPGHDLDNGRKVLVDYAEMPDPTDDDDLKLAHLYPSADR